MDASDSCTSNSDVRITQTSSVRTLSHLKIRFAVGPDIGIQKYCEHHTAAVTRTSAGDEMERRPKSPAELRIFRQTSFSISTEATSEIHC